MSYPYDRTYDDHRRAGGNHKASGQHNDGRGEKRRRLDSHDAAQKEEEVDDYDHRQQKRHQPVITPRDDRSHTRMRMTTDKEEVATTTTTKQQMERERRSRMAQLRSENDKEEAKLSAMEGTPSSATGGKNGKSSSALFNIFNGAEAIVKVDEADLEGLDDEEQMQLLLGFTGGFGSTKGEKVASNQTTAAVGVAAKNKARKYRQYMNRKNGFNRPLDKMD